MSNFEILRDKAMFGLQKKGELNEETIERLNYELDVIEKLGFIDYFLVLDKVKRYCEDKEYIRKICERTGYKIPKTGKITLSKFGRGSGVASIVLYGLGFTSLNPIKHGLYFERFLNLERISPADVDTDVSKADRPLLLEVLSDLFPYTSNIGTNGTIGVKMAIKDIGKALNVPFAYTNSLAKKLSNTDTFDDFINNETLMNEFYNIPDVDHEFYLNTIKRINGLTKSSGKHAGGVVLCGNPIEDYVPCRYDEGKLVTEVDMHFTEDVGFIKFDFLGLKTLDILSECELKTKVSCEEIAKNLQDKIIYEDLRNGKTLGVFQFEGNGITNLLKDIKVESFEDLVLCNALYRPSGIDNVFEGKTMLQHAVDRKLGKEPIIYLFPEEKQYLGDTYALMVYQETLMRRVRQLTGCSLGKADVFRRAVGKKDEKLLNEQLNWLVKEAYNYRFTESPNWDDETWRRQIIEQIKNDILACGKYMFGKNHACAYTLIGYCCAYYAHHYPEIFYSAMLNHEDNPDSIKMQLQKLQNDYNFKITSPDVNESGIDFTPVGLRTISFGLSTIKNMGKSAEAIVEDVEKRGRYSNLYDLLFRLEPTQCNKSAITALAKAGALDNLTEMNRCTLVKSIDNICKMRTNRMKVSHRKSGDYKASYEELMALVDKNDKKIQFEIVEAPESKTIMANYENESMGYFISCTPLDDYKQEINRYNAVNGEVVEGYYVGIISSVREIAIKNGKSAGKKMAFITLSCLMDTYDVTVFNGIYEADYENITQGNVVVIKGKRNEYNGNVSVVAEYVRSININGVREVEQAHLYLDMPLNPLKMNMLKNALNDKMVGNTGVYFHVPNGDKDIAMYIGSFSLNNFVIFKLESCGILKYGSLNG